MPGTNTNPFDYTRTESSRAAGVSSFQLGVVVDRDLDNDMLGVELRGGEEPDDPYPIAVPESESAPPTDSLVVVGSDDGDRRFLVSTVRSPSSQQTNTGLTSIATATIAKSVSESLSPTLTITPPFASGTDGTDLYRAGGFDGATEQDETYTFDVSAESVTQLAAMPSARGGNCGGVINGVLYSVGGTDTNNNVTADVYAFDISAGTWSTVTSIPQAKTLANAAVYSGELYVFGGGDGNATLDTVHKYDPAADSWTSLSSLPSPRQEMGTVYFNGDIWLTGGISGSTFQRTVWLYDPDTDTYDTGAVSDLQNTSGGHAAVVSRGKIHLVGGMRSSNFGFVTNATYYSGSDEWMRNTNLTTGLSGTGRASSPSGTDVYVWNADNVNSIQRFTYPDTLVTASKDGLLGSTNPNQTLINDTTGEKGNVVTALDTHDVTADVFEELTIYRQN